MYRCRMSDKMEMPNAPNKKNPIIVSVAFLGVMPPVMRYFFEDGSMLNKEEKIYTQPSVRPQFRREHTRTITPNDKLSPVERKALLSSILKFRCPGNKRTTRSTHIIDAPNVQAGLHERLLDNNINGTYRYR